MKWRYGHKMRFGEIKRKAQKMMWVIDDDMSGGIDFGEFCEYCKETNLVFLALAFPYLDKIRKKMLGIDYWVRESRNRPDLFSCDVDLFQRVSSQTALIFPHKRFKLDFPDIYQTNQQQAKEAQERKKKRKEMSAKMAESAYVMMFNACMDLIYSRRPVRKAFVKWREEAFPGKEFVLKQQVDDDTEGVMADFEMDDEGGKSTFHKRMAMRLRKGEDEHDFVNNRMADMRQRGIERGDRDFYLNVSRQKYDKMERVGELSGEVRDKYKRLRVKREDELKREYDRKSRAIKQKRTSVVPIGRSVS